jgi:hypothetical protein
MSDPVDIAIIGENSDLIVETDQAIQPDVKVIFEAVAIDEGSEVSYSWTEPARLLPQPPQTGSTKFRHLIKWFAKLPDNPPSKPPPGFLEKGPVVKFTVRGKGTGGESVAGTSPDHLRLRPAIEITGNVHLVRIMQHEFSILAGTFDRSPLQEFLNTLTIQQKKLLLDYDVGSDGNRLVIFVTMYPPTNARLMAADFTSDTNPAIPNACFSVFHCQGPGKAVALVCHTENFLVNLRNNHTTELITGPQAGMPAAQWQRRDSKSPVKFKIAAMPPDEHFMRGQVLHRIFTANGKDVMKGNTVHGMINTNGCWMLFRNFNWPRSKFRALDTLYRTTFRTMRTAPDWTALQRKLAAADIGYDQATATATHSTSVEKFLNYDRNYAYLWFCHDLVGIKYFSSAFDGWGYFTSGKAEGDVNFHNDYKTHGHTFEKTFPYSERGKPPPTNLSDEGNNAYYDPDVRKKIDRSFKVTNSLWRPNALGFHTATEFVPTVGHGGDRFGNPDAAQLQKSAWADLYIYRTDKTPSGGI